MQLTQKVGVGFLVCCSDIKTRLFHQSPAVIPKMQGPMFSRSSSPGLPLKYAFLLMKRSGYMTLMRSIDVNSLALSFFRRKGLQNSQVSK